MMLNKTQISIGIIATLFIFLTGFWSGFWSGRISKKCPIVITKTITSDTMENYIPITGGAGSPITVITYPKTKSIKPKNSNQEFKNLSKTELTSQNNYSKFTSVDTLRYDSLYVAITDTGDCNGILVRKSVFGGSSKIKTVTNTITQTIEKPLPLLQLNAGITTAFIGHWQSVDAGPTVQLNFKQKFTIGYSYLIGKGITNISFLTKVK